MVVWGKHTHTHTRICPTAPTCLPFIAWAPPQVTAILDMGPTPQFSLYDLNLSDLIQPGVL